MVETQYSKRYFNARLAELEVAYNVLKPDWQELADYFLPRSVRFLARNVNKQPAKNKKIKDSTPLLAVRNFSSGMMSGATSPATNWFKVKVRNYGQQDNYDIKSWCGEIENMFRDIFNSSNLYQILPAVYKQIGVFGLSVIALMSDETSILRCHLLPIGSYRLAKNEKGEVDTICRVYMETAKNLYDKFGEENVSKDVLNAIHNNRYEELFEIVHFVEPNLEYKEGSPFSNQKKFISVTYEVGNGTDKFLKKAGFDKFPYVVFEASCNGEDAYPSKGCGIYALPDAKQLMTLIKELGKAVKKMVSPAYQGSASLKNKKLSDNPGFFNEDGDNGAGIRPIHEVNPQVLELRNIIMELRENIKSIFYNDLFAMILNTAERGRTATEVNELKEEKLVLLSPLLEQIHTALKQILDWIFYTEMEVGILPPVPQELEGQEIEIEFISTLAQAMKAQNISSMERFVTFTANMAQAIDPVLIKKIRGENMIDDYADFANIDPSQIAPNEELEE